jgi:DNA-binding response OmpR family regulator
MSSQPSPIPASARKILVVDDDAVVVKALSLKLSAKGFKVITAADASEAVLSVRKEKPDLILLDVTFPPDVGGVAWDGFRVVEWLHRLEESQRIPVIIISGGDREKYKGRLDAVGAVAFFQKPINYDELITTIHKTLDEWSAKARPSAGGAPGGGPGFQI